MRACVKEGGTSSCVCELSSALTYQVGDVERSNKNVQWSATLADVATSRTLADIATSSVGDNKIAEAVGFEA